jgi:hypothetical protein
MKKEPVNPFTAYAATAPGALTHVGDIDFDTLEALRDGGAGPMDHPCPLCGPGREPPMSMRLVLRTWEETPGTITYKCARCEAKGYARAGDGQKLRPRKPKSTAKPERDDNETMAYVEKIWSRADVELPAMAVGYFRFHRKIDTKGMPLNDLRFDWHCPWKGCLGGTPCLIGRYTDPVTGAPRGLLRRPITFDADPKTKSLGRTGGCVIRLWPDDMIDGRLVIAEGIETALAVATLTHHRIRRLLRPVWAVGNAGNMRHLPVLKGIQELIICADNDRSGVGLQAAKECRLRWEAAGRRVEVLMPPKVNTDFNDWIKS